MVDLDKQKQQQEADRRTALLGLAAAKETGETEDCLSPEQLAALVEGKCTAERRQHYFDHLSVCGTCYRLWMELHDVVEAEQKEKQRKIVRFPGLKHFAWAGSALAAAASVVLYLNIVKEGGQPSLTREIQRPERKMSDSAVEHQPGMGNQQRGGEGEISGRLETEPSSAAAPATTPSPERYSKQTGIEESAGLSPQIKDKATPSPSEYDSITSEQSFSSKTGPEKEEMKSMPGQPHEQSSPDIDQWLALISRACIGRENDRNFWLQQYDIGEKLIKMEETAGLAGTRQSRLLKRVMPLVKQLGEGNDIEAFCAAVERSLRQQE